jgi:hypothetical protein
MDMAEESSSAPAAPRFSTKQVYVTIDQKPYEIVNMNVYDVLIAGAPDWFVSKQKVDFSFFVTLGGKELALPTYGVVLKNDGAGLDIRYQAPSPRWRDLLVKVLTEENRKA